jgi:hypothetical protein
VLVQLVALQRTKRWQPRRQALCVLQVLVNVDVRLGRIS